MRSMIVVLTLAIPGLLFGQSLAEVAKKEKERREKNKETGKEVHVVSQTELESTRPPSQAPSGEGGEAASTPETSSSTATAGSSEGVSVSEGSESEGSVPTYIPADAPLAERLAIFDQMKRHYLDQVKEIDKQIAENQARLREIESQIAATSALGGAGLPVAPQAGTGAATKPMTGQESASLVGEQNRLQAMNQTLENRKETLRLDLQARGRSANIPAGYLRF
jgi:hypothetical protein